MATASPIPRRRKLSRGWHRLLLTSHVVVSVGWLGAVLAKTVLGVAALAGHPAGSGALLDAANLLNVVFPPVAIGTIVTGVALSVGTKWGLLRHFWVLVKLLLTVGVISTAVGLGSFSLRLLVVWAVLHLLMLLVATVLSTYKPWGPIRRRAAPKRDWTSTTVEVAG